MTLNEAKRKVLVEALAPGSDADGPSFITSSRALMASRIRNTLSFVKRRELSPRRQTMLVGIGHGTCRAVPRRELGVRCVGAPIFNADRWAIAAVSVSGPTSRITPQNARALAQRVLTCCREISGSQGMRAKKKSHVASPFLTHYS